MRGDIRTLRNALTNVAYTVGRTFGVKVVFGGKPQTDGKTIWVSDLPLDVDKNPPAPFTSAGQCIAVVRSDIVHEAGHIDSTDFASAKAQALMKEEFVKDLLNAIEDTRIERAQRARFRGAHGILADGVKAMVEAGLVQIVPSSPAETFINYVLAWGAVYVNKQPALQPVVEACIPKLRELLGELGLKRLEAYLSTNYRRLRSTEDACDMAEEVLRLLQEIDEEQKQQQQQQQSSSGANPGAGGNAGQSGNSQPSAGDTSGSGQDGPGTGEQQKPGDGQGSGQSDKGGDANPTADANGSAAGSGAGTGASAILQDQSQRSPLVDYKKAMEAMAGAPGLSAPRRYNITDMAPEDKGRYDVLRKELASDAAVVGRRLVNYLLAQRKSRKQATTSGRLNRKRIAQVEVGNLRVFTRKHETAEVNTAVSIIIDASGSMAGRKADEAQKVMMLIADATRQLDIALEILGFDSGEPGVFLIKPFDMPYAKARAHIGGYAQKVGGGTALGNALFQAGYRLAEREEPRKLLLAITDGDTFDRELTTIGADLLSRSGIESIAFGIEDRHVEHYFPRHVYIDDVSGLGASVLRAFRQHLTQVA